MKIPKLDLYKMNLWFGGVCSGRIRTRIEGTVQTGRNVYVGRDVWIDGSAKVTIGDNVKIGPRCAILTKATKPDRTPLLQSVEIDDNVWMGASSIIYPGTYIGEGAVISPGAVVDKNVPSGAIVYGNPATILSKGQHNRDEGCRSSETIGNFMQAFRARMLSRFDRRIIRQRIRTETEGISIGEEVFVEGMGSVLVEKEVRVGDRVLITTTQHNRNVEPIGYVTSYYQTVFKRGCVVEPCTILTPGITIGEEAIVKAGSVITKNVPPRNIVQGNPARVLNGKGDLSLSDKNPEGEVYHFRTGDTQVNADFYHVFTEKILKQQIMGFQYVGKEVLVQPAGSLCFKDFWQNVIAPRVIICADQTLDGFCKTRPITLQGDCWLGAGCIILSGVTVHRGVVIGAGAVVQEDVPQNAIVVGNPGHLLKWRQIIEHVPDAERVMEALNSRTKYSPTFKAKILAGLSYLIAA